MELIKKEIELPKEMSEVKDFIVKVAKALVVDKDSDAAAKLLGLLPDLMVAVEGYEDLAEEAKSEHAINVYAQLVAELGGVFLKK